MQNLAAYKEAASLNERGHRVKREQRLVYGEWMNCRECNVDKLWEEMVTDHDKRCHKRSLCTACLRGALVSESVYREAHLDGIQRKWATGLDMTLEERQRIAFCYNLEFVVDSVLHVFIGVTTQAPHLRRIQHLGASGVECVDDAEAEKRIHELAGLVKQETLLPDAHLIGQTGNQVMTNTPHFHWSGYRTRRHAELAAEERYNRIANGNVGEMRCELINSHPTTVRRMEQCRT